MSEPALKVEIENGKYTVILEADGRLHALRNGEEWRDLIGDKLVLCLAQTVDGLRELAEQYAREVEAFFVDWAKLNKESPDHDPAYKVDYPPAIQELRRRLEELKK
jgi:hypothetical protein